METQTQTNPSEASRRTPRWRHWLVRGLIAGLLLFLAVVIIGEAVFLTNIPRNLVVNLLQSQIGLRISAKSLSTGWLGNTTLRDVTVTLPLADKAFLTIPELQVRHTSLPGILITQSLTIKKIWSDHAELDVLQDARGHWNLEQVVRMLVHPEAAGKNAKSSDNSNIPELPDVQINDATLVIIDDKNRSATIQGLSLQGASEGPLVWKYQATVPNHLNISGKIAPGGPWAHEINFALSNAGSWISPWVKSWPDSAEIAARWVGQIDADRLNARLEFQKVVYGGTAIDGPVEISAGDGKATIVPRGLKAKNRGYEATLDDGQIIVDADQVRTEALAVQFAGGRASVDGKTEFASGATSVHAVWRDIAIPASLKQSGDLSLEFTPTLNQPRFKATVDCHGAVSSGAWNAQVVIDGAGKDLNSLSLTVSAPQLQFQTAANKIIDLSGTMARVAAANGDKVFSLSEFRLGNGQHIAGAGEYDRQNGTAWFTLDGRDWPVPGTSSIVLDEDLDLWMTADRIHLKQLYLRDGVLKVYAQGDYVLHAPKPVNARVYVMKLPANVVLPPHALVPGGSLVSEFDLAGMVRPIDLLFKGNASGSDVTIGPRSLGPLKVAFDGTVHSDRKNLIRVDVKSNNLEVFGGSWTVAGWWPVERSAMRFETVSVQHLSLPLLAGRNDITGQLDGKWSVDIKHFSPEGIAIKGSADVTNFAFGKSSAGNPLFSAEQIQIPNIDIESGEVDIESINVVHKRADQGRANIDVWTTLDHLERIWLSMDLVSWPVQPPVLGDAMAVISAKGTLDTNLKTRSVSGSLDAQADLSWAKRPVANVQISSDLLERRAEIKQIQVQAFNGAGTGQASFDLDHPLASHADLTWSGVDLSRLQAFAPSLKNLSGLIDGSLQIHPATTPRPLEPLEMSVHIEPHNVEIEKIKIGPAQLIGFIGADRVVLGDSPNQTSQVAMAGGTVNLWGRISRPTDDVYQTVLQVNLENIDLDAVIPSGSKIARTPGVLNGTITRVAQLGSPDMTFGQGELSVSNSDLAGTGPISFLYNLMHVGHNANKPQGNGTIDFNFEGETVIISALRYFDRGTEVRASGYLNNIFEVPHCFVQMTAVGSVRPFASISLPGLSDLDKVMGTLQHDALAIRINGYMDHLDDPGVVKTIAFSSIGGDLQKLLFGDATATKGQPSE